MEQIMKLISLRMTLQTLTIAIIVVMSAYAEDNRSVSNSDLQAKIDYCKTCHGLSGQGFRGAFPIPRLAGQQPEYVENQLKAFAERRRTNPVVFNVAHALSPAMLAALTRQFEALNPKPLGGAPRELMAAGKMIYQEGVPGADIPPCASCHGADAKGTGPFPRLAGQLHDYILRKLTNWRKERGQDKANPDASAIMEPIAHGLTASQIAEVAAYLSDLE
jgi:cytochrome c553